MAKQTKNDIRQMLIYQVFPRNHSEQGNFQGVIDDLPRIRQMGADVLYVLPFHPIGKKNRKGDMGSPYAITDYYAVNEEYGNLASLQNLIHETHQAGLKLMMDIVINHTAPDHPFTKTHPEYYYRKPEGGFGNKVGDWTDIIDLDYSSPALWQEMTNMLTYWVKMGVDGFRCDVASFVPLDFWLQARAAVEKINPDVIWLAESVHKEFLQYYRNQGYLAHSDAEVFQAFDICYDYEVHSEWSAFIHNQIPLREYVRMLNLQECIYPANFSKLRFLENHDQPRVHAITCDKNLTNHWTAFSFFQKGTAFLYAGQERYAIKQPSLFTKDLVEVFSSDANSDSCESLIKELMAIKKRDIIANHIKYTVQACGDFVVQVIYDDGKEVLTGFFRLKKSHETLSIDVEIPDNTYENQLTRTNVHIDNGTLRIDEDVVIISYVK